MERICGWCRKPLGGGPEGPGTTHGICRDCAEAWMREGGLPEDRIRERLEAVWPEGKTASA